MAKDDDMSQTEMLGHADYPHWPGELYDCPACEAECFCDPTDNQSECVHCALTLECEYWVYDKPTVKAV